jgi:hypothetical protein
MRTRQIVLLIALVAILISCTDTPKPSNGIWDQSNFETANWN